MNRPPLINLMERAARKAGRALARDFGEVEHLQVSKKGPADFVSAADLRSEKILREELAKARPNHGFLMEESGATPSKDGGRWIVDPLDGTLNFLHGLPHFAISIAQEVDGELRAGVVYNPLTDDLYWAQRGEGAFINDRRLRVSARAQFAECLFATGIPLLGHGEHDRFHKELRAVIAQSAGVRRFGAAALDLAFVAAGRYDGFWEGGLQAWDIAAGIVILREAGGLITDFDGGPNSLISGDIVAGPPSIHGQLRSTLEKARLG